MADRDVHEEKWRFVYASARTPKIFSLEKGGCANLKNDKMRMKNRVKFTSASTQFSSVHIEIELILIETEIYG